MTTVPNTIIRLATAALLIGATPLAAQQHAPGRNPRAPTAATAIPGARRAALAWLRMLDARRYDSAYANSAKTFQGTTSAVVLAHAMDDARGQYAPFGARTTGSANFSHNPASAAPGDYVVFKFHTTVNDGTITELVTVERKEDGLWRVDGYLLEPGKR